MFGQKQYAVDNRDEEKPAPVKMLTDPEPIVWNVLLALVIIMVLMVRLS